MEENKKIEKSSSPAPPLEYMSIARDGLYIYKYDGKKSKEENSTFVKDLGKAVVAEWSHDGALLGIVRESANDTLEIRDAETYEVVKTYKAGGPISKLNFSPLSKYVLLFSRFDENTNRENVVIFSIEKNAAVFKCPQKRLSQTLWPSFKWTSKEKYCCRLVTNGVHIHLTSKMGTESEPCGKIALVKLAAFEPSPEPEKGNAHIAVFASESKGNPATIKIFSIEDLNTVKGSKNFYQAEECTFKWNMDGSSLLAITQSDVDLSGKSYYGSNKLFFFRSDGSFDMQLVSAEEGPVHDVRWSPSSNEFLLCKGPIPPQTTLHEGKEGKGRVSYGNLRRNTIRWNSFGSFFLLGGFGNLAGDLHVFDKNKKKVIGAAKVPCAVQCEFAPDGRHFLAATTSPRLRVDNCIKIYRYNGELLSQIDFNELYFASWRPSKRGVYKDRGVSRGREPVDPSASSSTGGGENTQNANKIYRPGHVRQQPASSEIVKILSLGPSEKSDLPPGAAPPRLTKTAARNARKKKGKADKKKQAEGGEEQTEDASKEDEENEEEESKVKANEEEEQKTEVHEEKHPEKTKTKKKKGGKKKGDEKTDATKEEEVKEGGQEEEKKTDEKESKKTEEEEEKKIEKPETKKKEKKEIKKGDAEKEENKHVKKEEKKDEGEKEASADEAPVLRKQIRTIKKKLTDIEKLKQKESLEREQQIKVNSEDKLKDDLQELQEKLNKLTLGSKK